MLVKIGDIVYDPNEVPILILLSKKDKENISNMMDYNFKYCVYPEEMNPEDKENISNMMDYNFKYCVYPEEMNPEDIITWMKNSKGEVK